MAIHPKAGQRADLSSLSNIPRLMTAYYSQRPKPEQPEERVSFGTSGHRGLSTTASFNEEHILAIAQAVVDYRQRENIAGPLFVGMDSHALSEAAFQTVLEVLCANGVDVVIDERLGYTPTPVISHSILKHQSRPKLSADKRADGIVITPSHNPPEYGGLKYNPPTGGPGDAASTKWIETRANQLLSAKGAGIRRRALGRAYQDPQLRRIDYVQSYVPELTRIIDMEAIAQSGLKLGVNPLGGSTLDYWQAIAEHYRLDLTITEKRLDPSFSFMTHDKDGKIRMDCSSPYAMASLISLREQFDLGFGNDPDGDRHGVVTREGLMNPNHYLAVMIEYLFETRQAWAKTAKVGKTLVSSALIDRVVAALGRELYEVPVGFKWFVDGLFEGWLGFGGEESAGASFLDFEGRPWSTDKDGLIACLLAAEMTAKTGKNPRARHLAQAERFGVPYYGRNDALADAPTRQRLARLQPQEVKLERLAGEPVEQILSQASGNQAAIGGLKICSKNAWFALRPSGTEDIYKTYAESFISEAHLAQVQEEAQAFVKAMLN